ncbi:MAG: antibiotic biosynthesis monooxygenase [Desulfobacteraceae bacterium]|jgi:heme-degrading monooxygenase HmoA
MFARLTIVQVKPDKIDETINLYGESVVPAAKSQKGYKGVYMLVDRKTGKGVSISLWENEENAIANEQSGYYQEQIGKFKDFFTAPPAQEGYEVVVQA